LLLNKDLHVKDIKKFESSMSRFLWHKNWIKKIWEASEVSITKLDSSTRAGNICWVIQSATVVHHLIELD